MKTFLMKISTIIFVTIALLLFSFICKAQEQIKKSNKIEIVNNKKYYVHEIKKGETLYAISKAYNIDQNIIAIENPDVFENLKVGSFLYIPLKIENTSSTQNCIIHIVEKGETLYSISRKYKVSIDDLNKINPELNNGLQIGQKINIPQKSSNNISNTSLPKDTSKFIYHKIEKNQTMYSISRKYDVSIDAIYQNNPELERNGLKNGDLIKIPKNKIIKQENNDEITIETKTDSLKTNNIIEYIEPVKSNDCGKFNYTENHETFKIALLLPIQSDALTIENEDEASSSNSNFSPQPKPFLEYYEGFLLAIDSLKKSGLNIELKLIDIKKDSAKTIELINNGELQNSDLIVGPVYEQNFKLVADYASKKGINIIFPINSQNSEVFSNSRVFMINSSFTSQMNQATKYLASFKDINYIVINNGTDLENEIITNYKTILYKEFSNNFNTNEVPYKEILYSNSGINGVESSLKKDIINVLIIPSGNQIFVINILTKLQSLTKKYKIILAGMPSWKKFDNNIEIEYLHNLNMLSFIPFNIDYSNVLVKNYIIDYRSYYKCEPTKFSFLGFDTGIYFLNALKNYGHDFQDCLPNLYLQLLESNFNFVKLGEKGGYENNGIFILHYNQDNDVKIVNIVTDKIKDTLALPDIQIRKIKPN